MNTPRERLLAWMPVTERRLDLARVSTVLMEGGEGPPVVLLHEQAAFGAAWLRVIPGLTATHRVIAPDLPGHGGSELLNGRLDADLVLAWLAELIERTCPSPPALVGHLAGGAIAARFAVEHGDRLERLVLVDSFGLSRFRPSPGFGLAVLRYVMRPSERSYGNLMRRCTVDFDALREGMGDRWDPYESYTLERVRTPSVKSAVKAMMGELGGSIPEDDLARIAVPTALIWGRHDPATRLRVAESASARYGWPLHVIEDAGDDPPLEQPRAFLEALRAALGRPRFRRTTDHLAV